MISSSASKFPIRLCIVGCGNYAKMVLDDIHDMTDAVELYFASRDLVKAKEFSDNYGGFGYFGSYEDAARDSRVQAMYFFTPHDLHLDNVKLASFYQKHILLEKPIGRTVPEARDIIKCADDSDVTLMVAENYRFLPLVDKCKEMISDGEIGKLKVIQIRHEQYEYVFGAHEWRSVVVRNGGGRFIDGGVHFVDIMLNLSGFPQSVYAVLESPKVLPNHEGEDGIMMMVRLPENVVGMVHYSGSSPVGKPRNWVQVTGTLGTLGFDPHESEMTLETLEGSRKIQVEPARRGVRHMVKEFQSCIVDNRAPLMSGREALNDLAVVLAAYQSASTGTEVGVSKP